MEIKVKKSQVKEIEDSIKAEVNKSMPDGVRKSVMDTEVEVTKGEYLSISKYFKGVSSGNWKDAEREKDLFKAMGENIGTEGGNLVPTYFSTQLIELLSERAVVRSMPGIQTMNVPGQKIEIARQDSGTTVTWGSENTTIAESTAPTFGNVCIEPKKMTALVPVSRELIRNAGINVDMLVKNEFVKRMGLAEDLALLDGTGGSQPLGIYNTPGVLNTNLSGAVMKFDNVLDADLQIREQNGTLTGWVASPVIAHQLRTLKDTTGQSIYVPLNSRVTDRANAVVAELYGAPLVLTNTVVKTKGSSANQTYAIAGQWSNAIIGDGEEMRIETSTQGTYFEKDQVGFKAVRFVDIVLTHPETFAIVKGIATS